MRVGFWEKKALGLMGLRGPSGAFRGLLGPSGAFGGLQGPSGALTPPSSFFACPLSFRRPAVFETKGDGKGSDHKGRGTWRRCTAARLYGCTVVRLYGCTTARLYGCTVVRLHSCTTAQLHDCTVRHTLRCQTRCLLPAFCLYLCFRRFTNFVSRSKLAFCLISLFVLRAVCIKSPLYYESFVLRAVCITSRHTQRR